jgi:hypothetical protein
MSRSSPAPPPEPERRTGDPEALVDALGGSRTHHHGEPSRPAADEPGHHRGPRRHPKLRLAGIGLVLVLVLLMVVLIL